MTWESLIPIIITALVAAMSTLGVNWYLQRSNYKNDYYKKVIEYRIKAYEDVGLLLNQFPFIHRYDGNDGYQQPLDEIGHKNFTTIIVLLKSLIHNGYWLTDEMRSVLSCYYDVVSDFYYDEDSDPNSHITRMAGRWEENEVFKSEAVKLMYKDMQVLYDVETFFKYKNANK